MKLLADENAEGPLIARLRDEGFDVSSVAELGAGIEDPEVLELSEREGRILLTNDKDFAELAFLQRTASVGIILLRLPDRAPAEKAEFLLEALQHFGSKISGSFTVVGERGTRRRSLPR